jgi:hypothetical protein
VKLDGAFLRNFDSICEPKRDDNATFSKVNKPWRVQIPFFQRPFAWGENEKEGHELIKKIIYDFNEYRIKSNNSYDNNISYFAGAIVTVKEEKKEYHDLIDGQQRITTLFLAKHLIFLLQRAYLENRAYRQSWNDVKQEITEFEHQFNVIFSEAKNKELKFADSKKKLVQGIDSYINKLLSSAQDQQPKKDNLEDLHNELIKTLFGSLYLPESGFSTEALENSYYDDYLSRINVFFKEHKLNFTYARNDFNSNLLHALKSLYIELDVKSGPSLKFIKKIGDKALLLDYEGFIKEESNKGILQYVVATKLVFDTLYEIINKDMKSPALFSASSFSESELKTKSMLEYLYTFFMQVSFCVVRSGDTNDAYTLFEVLNDRSLSLNDLDLIKNIFYRYYVENTNDDEDEIDKNISKLENIWSSVFVDNASVFKTEILKYTFIQFLTGKPENALAKDAQKYRKKMNDYLSEHRKKDGYDYKFRDIENEFKVLSLANEIVERSGLGGNKMQEKCIDIEKDYMNTTIVLRTIHLLHALKQKEVLATFFSLIIKVYLTCENNEIDFKKFEKYLENILRGNDSYRVDHDSDKSKNIGCLSECASEFWSLAMMGKDYSRPKSFAKKVLTNSCFHSDLKIVNIDKNDYDDAEKEFLEWLKAWEYKDKQGHFKIRVLFLNLLKLSQDDNGTLVKKPFLKALDKTKKVQLDHIEPQNPSDIEEQKYFKGRIIGNNENTDRNKYVDGLGNMMILTPKENIDKTNKPAIFILDALKDCGLEDWWLSKEIAKKFEDSKFVDNNKVPKEYFFDSWKHDLIQYFNELIEEKLYK